ncbi:MAG TPA: alpha/beta hydrolase-fold protein [Gemmatimonadales bacterium]|nr:alpha/beta hydrolase-fold protein [Gemmatimonadales bacterium]
MRLPWGLAFVALPAWAQSPALTPPAPPRDPMPRHVAFIIESRAVGEPRVINVYTPPGYDSLTSTSFPVVYMPDGGLAEDFPHIANTLDSLIALRAIAPVILVGIENTERRRDLTGPTAVASDSAIARRVGGSAGFRRFIREELMPEIRRRYRSTDETTIVGESLAGLFIVETFLLEPDLFRRYIALSPSLWWNAGVLLRIAPQRLKELTGGPRTLYLTAATEPGIAAETAALAGILREHATAGLLWYYEPRPDLEHSTIFRRAAPTAFVTVLK